MKKIFFSLCVLFCFNLFAAPVEKMNISVFTLQTGKQPPADNKTYKWIEEKFGITFSWDILTGKKETAIKRLISSMDLPDLVEVDSEKFQKAGCLRDLKPLIEKYCPNLMKHYNSVWEQMIYADSEKDSKGNIVKEHIYSLPKYGVYDGIPSDTYYNSHAWWIQKAVLKEFGYPVIKTVDQYFDLLEAYYLKYPLIDGKQTIPFSIITAAWEAYNLWNPPGFLGGYPNDGNGHVELIKGKYVFKDNYTDENARRWFTLANGYFQRGLIDPESFTDNRNQYYTKIVQGRVLGMFLQGWELGAFTGSTNGPVEKNYVPLALTFDENIKPHYRDRPLPGLQNGYGITVKCSEAKAIKILQFMDAMLEEENQIILYWGFENEDWQKDAYGRPYRTQTQITQQNTAEWILQNRAKYWAEEAPKLEGRMPDGYTRYMDELPWEYARFQEASDLELWAAYGVNSNTELMDPAPPENPGWYPMWKCEPLEQNGGREEEAAVALNGFEIIMRKYLPQLITCKPEDFNKTWDEYCRLFKPFTDSYNEYMQSQLDKRIELFGGISE